jgi:uncharacterized protein YchJ
VYTNTNYKTKKALKEAVANGEEVTLYGYNYTITRNLGTRHDDPAINAFLAEGNYENIDAWMRDSDFTQRDGMWFHAEGHPVDPEGCIEGAMEASGFFEHFRD